MRTLSRIVLYILVLTSLALPVCADWVTGTPPTPEEIAKQLSHWYTGRRFLVYSDGVGYQGSFRVLEVEERYYVLEHETGRLIAVPINNTRLVEEECNE
jgi:hypothetical protein